MAEVTGYTRYAVEGDVATHAATITARRPRRHRPRPPVRTERNPVLRGTKHRVAIEPRSRLPWPQRRPHADHRPRDQGQPATGITLLHVRFHDRLPVAAARRVLEGYRGRYAALPTRSPRPSRPSATTCSAEVPLVDLLTEPVTSCAERWRTRDRVIGVGHRRGRAERGSAWSRPARPGLAERLFTDAERAYGERRKDPTERFAARFAAKEAVMKALGVGVGACKLRDVEVVRAPSGQPSVSLHGRAAALAERQGVREWRLTLTHTDLGRSGRCRTLTHRS